MKKLNRNFIKGTNWALAGLMSFLGFSSCFPTMEYGTPTAEYVVSGKVTDMEGKGLQGITVEVPSIEYTGSKIIEKGDVLYTSNSGNFMYNYEEFPYKTLKIKLKFSDKLNNTFESDSTVVVFTESELNGGKGWNEGKAEKNINIKLKRKESD